MSKQNIPQVRIIGGDWRGRKVTFASLEGLRPTPDRIRETLFNWLAFDCPGSRVLDCFAGSGVLGFEAMSRGAREAVLVEKEKSVSRHLSQQVNDFGNNQIEVITGDILEIVSGLGGSFDLVFIDPPYAMPGLRGEVIESLCRAQLLNEGAKIFLEWPAGEDFEFPVTGFSWLKTKKAGQVQYAIAEWRSSR